MRTSVVAGVNASPVLEFSKHVFDFVTLAIELFVMCDRLFSIGFGRYAGFDLPFRERFSEPVRIITFLPVQLF